ncbi:MAG TPA: lipid-A-disaccharide synthase [Acetobacteraceae bacterium]|nr:lipid-A-disaccharide synthase [Acetobacteraceae bacterium]
MTRAYLVAGEASGDVLGARLIAALRAREPDLTIAGVGGARMAAEGLESLFPMADLAVMGIVEVLPAVRLLRRRLAEIVRDIKRLQPDVVVTIDSPGFMLRILRAITPFGIPRAHYVAPQVWAWREHRVRHFPGLWEALLCLLPFEPDYFAGHGLPARFVGHPVLQSGADIGDGARFRARHGIAAEAPVLVLMPGSRRSEAPRLLPVFGATLERLEGVLPGLVPVVPVSAAVAATVAAAAAGWRIRPIIASDLADKHDAYATASAALTKSGTSTLELALAGVPMAVTYRVNPLSAMLARRMIRVEHVAMVNLLAGRRVVPELLQQDCTPARLAETVRQLIADPEVAAAQRAAFGPVLASLRPPGGEEPAAAAAEAVLGLLRPPPMLRESGLM